MRAHLFIFWLLLLAALASCGSPDSGAENAGRSYQRLEGQTMGTYYAVTYRDSLNRDFQTGIDSLLLALNLEVSTYIDTAAISRFNRADAGFPLHDEAGATPQNPHFLYNLQLARDVSERTGGALDPTVMPLVNYWGFGYTEKKPVTRVDSLVIDSLMQYVGMDKVEMAREGSLLRLRKAAPGVQLDLSAVAKGYGVDLVGWWLEARGVRHYLVDIGGEARARGESPRSGPWTIGINVPQETAGTRDIQEALRLRDRSIATSGNYRNFYEVAGVKYSHTINPRTGFPERNTLLSASVITSDCATADAYATAFMVMGVDRAFTLAGELPEVEAYFIYGLPDGGTGVRYTPGLETMTGEGE